MARTYIAVPIDPAHAAEVLASTLDAHRSCPDEAREKGYTGPPRILRLRDPGPSLRERVAVCDSRVTDVAKWVVALESAIDEVKADLLDLRTRVGDLEREPAPVRPEPGSVPADPDRLAKVVHRTCDGVDAWDSLHEISQRIYRRVADAVADACAEDRAALLARAEKAEDFLARIANGSRAVSTAELLPGDIALARAEGRVFVCPDGTGCVLVPVPEKPAPSAPRDPLADPQPGDWFVDTDWDVLRFDGTADGIHTLSCVGPGGVTFVHTIGVSSWLSESRRFGRRPMTPAEVQAFKRDGTRPTAAPSEAEMAAELRREGWTESPIVKGWWAKGSPSLTTETAHATMRAAKGAR